MVRRNVNAHAMRMPETAFRELARGGGGGQAIEVLRRAQYSKNLLLIHATVTSARRLRHPGADAAARGYRQLCRMAERAPVAAHRLIGSPVTGLWALHTMLGLTEGRPGADPGGLTALVERLARPAGPEARIRVEAGGRRLDMRIIAADADDYLTVGRPDRELTGDPARLRLWRARIGAGWRRLVRHHREVADEVAATMSVLVPEMRTGPGHSSATLRHGFGLLVMSPPEDARSAAATLAHEVQHAKLSVVMDLFPLVRPEVDARFYAPWRADPRPAAALLHGAYAHLGVAGFWRRELRAEPDHAARAEAEVEFVRWHTATARATADLLAADVLSPIGRRFVALMSERLDQWRIEPVTPASRTEAARRGNAHRRQWLSRNR